jgi:hypothetical protein
MAELIRSENEIERATDIVYQLHYLGQESLENLVHSVLAELGRKAGFRNAVSKEVALFAVKEVPVLCQDEGCPQFGTKHVCVEREKAVSNG